MEGSQYGFRAHHRVQMVAQRARWVQQQAITMANSGTLIRIDLDFQNVFNSAGHSLPVGNPERTGSSRRRFP